MQVAEKIRKTDGSYETAIGLCYIITFISWYIQFKTQDLLWHFCTYLAHVHLQD